MHVTPSRFSSLYSTTSPSTLVASLLAQRGRLVGALDLAAAALHTFGTQLGMGMPLTSPEATHAPRTLRSVNFAFDGASSNVRLSGRARAQAFRRRASCRGFLRLQEWERNQIGMLGEPAGAAETYRRHCRSRRASLRRPSQPSSSSAALAQRRRRRRKRRREPEDGRAQMVEIGLR